MDEDCDDKDDSKRKSRNLSEKKRRDQFNLLVNELSSMVSSNNRKMDKSTVLKSTISFLKNYNEVATRSRVHEIQDDWKPSYLSNEEFTHLVLEALDGFIIVFSSNGRIFYASESITSLLGHLPNDLLNTTIYDLAYEEEHTELYNLLLNPTQIVDPSETSLSVEKKLIFNCHLKRSALDYREEATYELVEFVGYFRCDLEVDGILTNSRGGIYAGDVETGLIFVGIGRLQTPQLIREMTIVDTLKTEFSSRHSLEWKFLFLDHRAPPIIGYLPFEVLGTSGYDYYHVDDLEKVVNCHESLMQKGEGTSCYYRFLTKGQQWIWLQTRFFITYHQWNSKPEFVVCTHRVVSYSDGIKQSRSNSNGKYEDLDRIDSSDRQIQSSSSVIASSPWSTKSTRISRITPGSPSVKRQQIRQGPGSDSTSISADSITSRQSFMSQYSKRSRVITGAKQSTQLHPISHTQSSQNQTISLQSLPSSIFLEPPHPQYLSTSPHQTASSPIYQGNSSVISPFQTPSDILGSNVVITPAQTQIQDHLQRKHEELQQLIVHQQEELRRVSEQLLMARYGIIPTIALPFVSSVGSNATNTITYPSQINESQISNPLMHHTQTSDTIRQDGDELISYMQLTSIPSSEHEIQNTPHPIHNQNIRLEAPQMQHTQQQQQQQQHQLQQQQHLLQPHFQQQNTELGVIPFQMTQDQAQILFTSNLGSPHSTHHSQ